MSSAVINTRVMTPGFTGDCFVPGCKGVTGGFCANSMFASQNFSWCCEPNGFNCWGEDTPGCRSSTPQDVAPLIKCGLPLNGVLYAWCCDGRVEICPSRVDMYYICEPRNFTNPATSRPADPSSTTARTDTSSSTTGTATSTEPVSTTASPVQDSASAQTSSSQPSNSSGLPLGAAIGIAAAGVVVLALVIFGVYKLINRRAGHASISFPSESPFEIEAIPAPKEIQGTAINELEAEEIHELQGGDFPELEGGDVRYEM